MVQARTIDVHICLRFAVSRIKFPKENNTLPLQGVQGKVKNNWVEWPTPAKLIGKKLLAQTY